MIRWSHVIAVCALLLAPQRASADWLITPFLGTTFGGDSPLFDAESSRGTPQTIFGGSVALLTPQIFGVEADFGYSPRFFESDNRAGLVTGSNLTTLTGNIILAVPLAITHESLRPYFVGGGGLMRAASSTIVQFSDVDRTLTAIDIGGGAIGLISPKTGFRFDLRHFRSVHTADLLLQPRRTHLSFWRASVGVTIRY